jgi:hypothetical protein
MAADSVHANITLKIKKNPNVYNFDHLCQIIQPFKLKRLKSCKFIKNHLTMYAKFDFENEYKEYDILQEFVKKRNQRLYFKL